MSKHLPLLRTSFAAAVCAAVSAAAGAPALACETPVFIDAPTTLNDPVECIIVTSESPIEGDITNNVQIGNAGGDFAVSVVGTTVTGRFINNGLIIQDGPTPSNVSFATYAGADIAGGIVNNGTIRSTTGIGLSLGILLGFVTPSPVTQTGAIDNFGIIDGGIAGFDGIAGSFLNQLWNHEGATISGGTFGILTESTFALWTGGIRNDGAITGGGNAINLGQFNTVPLTFAGGITNSATGTIIATGASSIVIINTTFSGGIANDGTISGNNSAIFISGPGTGFSGDIVNGTSGIIAGNLGNGIYLESEDFQGSIVNAGRITSAAERAIFLPFVFGNFSGDIFNAAGALIEGATGGIDIRTPNWTGILENEGTIRALAGDGVRISNGTGDLWQGIVVNHGLIEGGAGPVLSTAGLRIDLATWDGLVHNTGTITSARAGVLVAVDTWTANDFDLPSVINEGTMGGGAAHSGLLIGSKSFTGTILNAATGLMSGTATGFGICDFECSAETEQIGVNFIGSFVNQGRVENSGTTLNGVQLGALHIFANTWTGDVLNDVGGVIASPAVAVAMLRQNEFFGEGSAVLPVVSFDGNFINRGTILGGVDLRVADWTGNFDNSGAITATGEGIAAFKFIGGIEGLLLNSGTITGPVALDLGGVTTAATYRQTGAGSQTNGDILLSSISAITLDFRGGSLTGDVVGGTFFDDRFEVNAGAGAFAYLEGVMSNMAAFAVNSGTASIGASALGANGAGVTMTNAGALSVGAGATLYLDDNTSITATSASFTPTSTFAAFFTTNTEQHATITVSETAALAGSFVAYLDPATFATTSERSFLYEGVISGPVTGTFSSVTLANAPTNLFRVTPLYNSFDLLIELVSFGEFADPESPNQASVGDALDEIFEEGTEDEDLLNLIDTIGESPLDDIGDIYDAIAGSTQADTDLAALKADDPWKQSVAQRVDAARSTGCTITGDTWCRTRYAQAPAAPVQTDAAEDPDAFAWLDTGLRDVGATSVWGRLVGIWGETDGGVSSPASNQRTYAVIAGADHVVDGTLLVGLAGQYVRTKADFDGSENESSVESLQAGAYFSYGGAETYLNGNVSAIATHASTKRIFSVGAIDYLAHVRYPSTSVTGSLELGTIFEVGHGYRLEPHAGLNFVGQFTDAYAEHGAGGLGLIVDPDDVHSLRSLIGARASRVYELGDRKIVPELRLEWRHEYLDRNTTFLAAFQGAPGVTFLVACEPTARDVVVVGGGLTLPVSGRITGYLDAEGAFSEDTRAGTLSLGARATW